MPGQPRGRGLVGVEEGEHGPGLSEPPSRLCHTSLGLYPLLISTAFSRLFPRGPPQPQPQAVRPGRWGAPLARLASLPFPLPDAPVSRAPRRSHSSAYIAVCDGRSGHPLEPVSPRSGLLV